MNLPDHLIGTALQLNSDCLRIILSRNAQNEIQPSSSFTPEAIRDIDGKLERLSAVWHLLKPLVKKSDYKQAKHRLNAARAELKPELQRVALTELLAENDFGQDKSKDKNKDKSKDKPKVQILFKALGKRLEREAESSSLDVNKLSLILQQESRCWRELKLSPNFDIAHVLKRFARAYNKCRIHGAGKTKEHASVLVEQLRQQEQWHLRVCRVWHQLILVRQGLRDSGLARIWYLERLIQSLERSNALLLLAVRLEKEVLTHKKVSALPGRLDRYLGKQQGKLILRQLKLYDGIFGQSPKAYHAFISGVCSHANYGAANIAE